MLKVSENVRNIARYIGGFWRCDVASIEYLDATTALLPFTSYIDKAYVRELTAVGNVTLEAALGVTGLSTLASVKVGGGTTIVKILSAVASLDFPSVAAGAFAILTMAVPGAVAGNGVLITLADAGGPYDLGMDGWVSAPDVVSVRVFNPTAAPINPAAQNYRAVVFAF